MPSNLHIYHSDGSTEKVCSSETDKWRTSYLFHVTLVFSILSLPCWFNEAQGYVCRGGYGACVADYQNHIKRKNVVFFKKTKQKKTFNEVSLYNWFELQVLCILRYNVVKKILEEKGKLRYTNKSISGNKASNMLETARSLSGHQQWTGMQINYLSGQNSLAKQETEVHQWDRGRSWTMLYQSYPQNYSMNTTLFFQFLRCLDVYHIRQWYR